MDSNSLFFGLMIIGSLGVFFYWVWGFFILGNLEPQSSNEIEVIKSTGLNLYGLK